MTLLERDRLKKAISDYAREASKSEQSARKALKETGIYTSEGKLAPEYDRPRDPKAKDHAA